MNSLARNALRFSMAGAGIAVLGAGVAGQASAAELPEVPDLSSATDSLPTPDEDGGLSSADGSVAFGQIEAPELGSSDLPELPADSAMPGLDSLGSPADALPTGEQQAATEDESSDDGSGSPLDALPTDALSTEALSTEALPTLEIPEVMYVEAPTVTL